MVNFFGKLTARFPLLLATTVALAVFGIGCSSTPEIKPLTISEQIKVDTKKASSLEVQFLKSVTLVKSEAVEKYLTAMAQKLAAVQEGFDAKTVAIKIHDDRDFKYRRFFSFPGTTIYVPRSFLKSVAYENELAAALSYELANVINRHLVNKLEKANSVNLVDPGSIFDLIRPERVLSIAVGERLLYQSGYDLRGMPSFFRRYDPKLSGAINQGSAPNQKEVDFNWKEAQHAKSEYLPSSNPTVRSTEFIKMKKGINRL